MRSVARNRVAKIFTAPAPVGGWNARDALAEMGKNDAVILDNLIPQTTQCVTRGGSSNHVTGISGTVETLAVYAKLDGTWQMFGAAGGSVYNVTSAGAVGAAVISGLSNARFQTVNFATTGGKYLYMVNGADKPQLWDGSTWVAVDGASSPSITGVTTTSLIHVNVFQKRLWFIEKDTMKVWYLPVESIGGAAQSLDLSSLFPRGGYLMAMGTLSMDSGSGMDDHAVFITSEGEVAVYRGTAPASAATWYLVGVYTIGRPIGRRCIEQYGGDSLFICADGVVPMSKALISGRTNTGIGVTNKIQLAVNEAVSDYGSAFGWQLISHPSLNLLILNVPVSAGAQQYVMYALNGSWCRFTGWNASCFARMGDRLFYGANGAVVEAMTGLSDNGVAIEAEGLTSFQYHGGNGLKRYTMARPMLSYDDTGFSLLHGLNLDYDTSAPTGTPTLHTSTYGLWDDAVWDIGLWGGGFLIRKNWQTVGGVGYCAAYHLKISASASTVRWQSTDYIYEMGQGFV
jgi:hypothetical protein